MHRTRTILSSLAVVVSALGATGCSSSSSSTAPGDDSSSTPVSFKTDIMPIFQQSCTLSSVCHGQMNNSAEENLYLGENAGNDATSIMNVYAGLVGVVSLEDPNMNIVTAGDVSKSYLTYKDKGTQDTLASECSMASMLCPDASCTAQTPCGASMPYLSSMLDSSKIDLIDNWITQGAMNN
jgi:hypothetical protein